jgi:pimeloyl-ACP methyl ester carboxylesterase
MSPVRHHKSRAGPRIAYMADRRNGPSWASSGLFWLGGFKSAMDGTKAQALARWARGQGRECVRFDYSGHGASDGRIEEGTISRWLDEACEIFEEISAGPQILIGSSMGGWLALLLMRRHLERVGAREARVRALVLIAPAVDMTEELMWKRFDAPARAAIEARGVFMRPSAYGDGDYPITRALIEDGRTHLMLGGPIPVACPVRILQGLEDRDVPCEHAVRLARALDGEDITVTLVHGGDHRLSRDTDIARLLRTVERLSARADKRG